MSARVKAFYADLTKVKNLQIENVMDIRRGDSDGEVTLKYQDANLEGPLDIQILATDMTSYPDGSSFMIFTSSDTCSADMIKQLEQVSASTYGHRLQDVVQGVSTRLALKLQENLSSPESGSVGDDSLDDGGEDLDVDVDDFETIDSVNDEYFGPERTHTPKIDDLAQFVEGLQRIQRELRLSKLAGFSTGIFTHREGRPEEIVSLSIRVSKLGLPPTAVSAWGLQETDYLVMLIKLLRPYPDLKILMSQNQFKKFVAFRFGKCTAPKPAAQCARMAFESPDEHKVELHDENQDMIPILEQAGVSFSSIHMSNTLNDLLNNHFSELLKIRRNRHCTWDAAQYFLGQAQRRDVGQHNDASIPSLGTEHCNDSKETSSYSENHMGLHQDSSLEPRENISFILVAMQFALHRLQKCAEYCMVCHRRQDQDFESLKPYVCSRPLCLYQYLSLAFGASLETEVVQSPHVVDLLISLFFAALTTGRLRELPRGLALKVPVMDDAHPAVKINISLSYNMFRVSFDHQIAPFKKGSATIREGDWVLIVVNATEGFEKHVCRITHWLDEDLFSFQKIDRVANPAEILPIDILKLLPHKTKNTAEGWLLEAPGRNLGAWTRMNRSTLTLVRWIVASNTSYLVQDSAVPDILNVSTMPAPGIVEGISATVIGLSKSWMLFRFAQGSPDRERAFVKAVEDLSAFDASKKDFPTLFAWHGSPIGNWHNIIRTGLDFSDTLHGRSFGHGVYLSKNFNVSSGYMGERMVDMSTYSGPWPMSNLRPRCALSICEIVNSPERFVSANPHYVINKPEWIQCRYLLLQVDPTSDAIETSFSAPLLGSDRGYIKQDPLHAIQGMLSQPLKIPVTATPFLDRLREAPATEALADLEVSCMSGSHDESDDGDDPEMLTENIRSIGARLHGRKRTRGISLSEHSDVAGSPARTRPLIPHHDTTERDGPLEAQVSHDSATFRPGALDFTSLPQLPEPSWAASSRVAIRTLTRELQELLETQSQNDTASLGWHFDVFSVNNLFHWIVELHTFDPDLPLAKDMVERGYTSIVLEIRFGENFPMSPPFVRVIRPRFLPFLQGGGGHVTAGGAICSEMLTSSGWSPAFSIESVFLQIRLGLCDRERPARLETGPMAGRDYSVGEAVAAYERAARAHGWTVPQDLAMINTGWGRM